MGHSAAPRMPVAPAAPGGTDGFGAPAPPAGSRRALAPALAVGGALAVLAAAGVAGVVAYLRPRRFSSEIDAGPAAGYPVGAVRHFQAADAGPDGRASGGESLPPEARDFHLVRRPDGFVAFWHRCTHRGCAVPFRPEYEFPVADRVERGLFRCPCHGSTFSRDEAEVVFGPAERPLDTLPVRVEGGRVLVTVRAGSERRRQRGEVARAARA